MGIVVLSKEIIVKRCEYMLTTEARKLEAQAAPLSDEAIHLSRFPKPRRLAHIPRTWGAGGPHTPPAPARMRR
jgi:hypothetical protein